jgi:inner membrane protein
MAMTRIRPRGNDIHVVASAGKCWPLYSLNKYLFMPNAKTHIKIGAAIGLASGAFLNLKEQEKRMAQSQETPFNWREFLIHCALGISTGAAGGILPDLLEPAYHPNHRNICHSLAALTGVGYGGIRFAHQNEINPYLKTILVAICASYTSHIILDGNTAKGVPLLG